MGQNMVGWVRLRLHGLRGTTITLRHAEILDKDGNFYAGNLRSAEQTVSYTLAGKGIEVLEPHFTFQGFRYVELSGLPGKLTPESLTGIVVHSDMPITGVFESSNPRIAVIDAWDRAFLDELTANDRVQLLAYKDEQTWREAGQGGFEIRTLIAVAGAAEGHTGEVWFYEPIPIFAVGCTIAVMNLIGRRKTDTGGRESICEAVVRPLLWALSACVCFD